MKLFIRQYSCLPTILVVIVVVLGLGSAEVNLNRLQAESVSESDENEMYKGIVLSEQLDAGGSEKEEGLRNLMHKEL